MQILLQHGMLYTPREQNLNECQKRLCAEFFNIRASLVWFYCEVLWRHASVRSACLPLTILTVLTHMFHILFGRLPHRRAQDRHRLWPVLFGIRRNDPLWALCSPNLKSVDQNKPLSRYHKNSVALILCHFSQPVHDCSLTQLWFCFSFLFSLTHLWSSFICSLLVWSKTIGLSSLPPSQSSVDHKEFKRCGPFDPYINAKVCTHSAAETTFLLTCLFAFLLCRLCCAWVWFAAAACRGRSAAELRGGFSVDSCSLAFCSCLLVIFSLIQMLCLTFKWCCIATYTSTTNNNLWYVTAQFSQPCAIERSALWGSLWVIFESAC